MIEWFPPRKHSLRQGGAPSKVWEQALSRGAGTESVREERKESQNKGLFAFVYLLSWKRGVGGPRECQLPGVSWLHLDKNAGLLLDKSTHWPQVRKEEMQDALREVLSGCA